MPDALFSQTFVQESAKTNRDGSPSKHIFLSQFLLLAASSKHVKSL